MKIDVLTLFPGMFEGVLSESILRIAQEKELLDVRLWDIRDFTTDRHRSADDRPYGGGPGMVMKVEPIFACVEHVAEQRGEGAHLVFLTPRGRRLTQEKAAEFAGLDHLTLICGHYEGVDERVMVGLSPEEVSIGDYVLSGGELAAMVVIDTVARLLPGVLGSEQSLEEESFARTGYLEYPQYTRPAEFRGMTVPDVLLSGHHELIRTWRESKAKERFETRRDEERYHEAT